jgi:hypothetical protein
LVEDRPLAEIAALRATETPRLDANLEADPYLADRDRCQAGRLVAAATSLRQ